MNSKFHSTFTTLAKKTVPDVYFITLTNLLCTDNWMMRYCRIRAVFMKVIHVLQCIL